MSTDIQAWINERRKEVARAQRFPTILPGSPTAQYAFGERRAYEAKAGAMLPTALSMVEAVLELHEPINGFVGDPSRWECNVCADDRGPKPYPCPTVRALEGAINDD